MDPFYNFGKMDQLEVGLFMAHAAHLTSSVELETVYDMITVNAADKFQEAIRRKLILEIASAAPQVVPAQWRAPGSPPRVDCQIGEKQWRSWRRYDRW